MVVWLRRSPRAPREMKMSREMSVLEANLRVLPRRIFSQFRRRMQTPSIHSEPRNPRAWIALARKKIDTLPPQTQLLMDHHDLVTDSGTIAFFQGDIEKGAGSKLQSLASNPTPAAIAEAIDEISRWVTLAQSAHAHRAGLYFAHAEEFMPQQCERKIWPLIEDEKFE